MTTQIESQDQEIKVLKQSLADKNVQVQTVDRGGYGIEYAGYRTLDGEGFARRGDQEPG